MASTIPEPQPQAAPQQPQKRHPWHWIVPCVLLLLVCIGLAIWAISLNNNLDDEKAHSAQVEQQAAATQDDVQAVSDQVDNLTKSLTTAADELSQSTDEAAQKAQSALTDIQNSLNSLGDRAKAAKDKLSQAIKDAKGETQN
jgi:septal ring factor EnvC (AmiA/AmiB activator)